MRDLSDELLEKSTTSLYEVSIVIALHFHVRDINGHGNLLGDGGNVAAGPAIIEDISKGLELVEPSLTLELSLRISACDSVLGDLSNFDRVSHSEGKRLLFDLIFMVLCRAFNLL